MLVGPKGRFAGVFVQRAGRRFSRNGWVGCFHAESAEEIHAKNAEWRAIEPFKIPVFSAVFHFANFAG